jgi:hypothetical protein
MLTGSCELVEQRLSVPEVGGLEAIGEPVIDRREKIAGPDTLTLVAPQPGERHGSPKLPHLGPLPARLGHLQPAVPCLPFVERGRADVPGSASAARTLIKMLLLKQSPKIANRDICNKFS